MSNAMQVQDGGQDNRAGNLDANTASRAEVQAKRALLADSRNIDGSFSGKAASEMRDFGEGVFYSAVENPFNGAVQLLNHASGANLPQLDLVDARQINQSIGGQLGEIVGTAADVYGLTLATGGLGGAGYLASAARMGAVGAAYMGVFQPSDPGSKSFYKDRLTNAAIAGTALAGMGGAAAALDAGALAAPAARSFLGSVAYSAVSGAAGGGAYAEANAVLKEGKALPKLSDLGSDVVGGAEFGAAFGGIAYGVNGLMSAPAKLIAGDNAAVDGQDGGSSNQIPPAAADSSSSSDAAQLGQTPASQSQSNSDMRLRPVFQQVQAEGPSLNGKLLVDGKAVELDAATYATRNGENMTLQTTKYPIKVNGIEVAPGTTVDLNLGDKIESFDGWNEKWRPWAWEDNTVATIGANVSIPKVSLVDEQGRVLTGEYQDIYKAGANANIPESSLVDRIASYLFGDDLPPTALVTADAKGVQINAEYDGHAGTELDNRFMINGKPATFVDNSILVSPDDELVVGGHKWTFQIARRDGFIDGAHAAAKALRFYHDADPVVLPPTNVQSSTPLPDPVRPSMLPAIDVF